MARRRSLDIKTCARNALPNDFREVIRMLEDGRFPVNEAISAVIPFEAVPATFTEWDASPSRFTKIVVAL